MPAPLQEARPTGTDQLVPSRDHWCHTPDPSGRQQRVVAKTLTHTYVRSPGLGGGLGGHLGLSLICSGTPHLQH